MGLFDLTIVLTRGPNDSHCQVLKCLNPAIYLWRYPNCPHCEAVSAYFKEQGCQVTHGKLNSAEHQVDGCRAQIKYKDQHYAVELPRLHDQPVENVAKRLRSALEGRRTRPAPHDHQKDLVNHLATRDFNARNTPAMTVYWEMGSGKTLGGLFVTQHHRCKRTIVVCHNSTIGYWVSAIKSIPFVGTDETPVMMLYEVIGYTAFRNFYTSRALLNHVNCLIIDEAHYFRNSTDSMQPVIHVVHGAKNVLLLTGTPLVNADTDIVGMLQLTDMDGKFDWRQGLDSETGLPTPEAVHSFLQTHVSWYDPKVHREAMYRKHYPTVDREVIRVPMTWPQTFEYMIAREATFQIGGHVITGSKSNRYNSRTRAICNAPDANPQSSNKLRAIMRKAGQFVDAGPQCVHSSLVESCLGPLIDMVRANARFQGKHLAEITGKTPTAEREVLQRNYNRGKLDMLFISDASQFGMDLQGTVCMHMAEPHANVQTEKQTGARVVRMGSHTNTNYKHVYLFYYVSTFPREVMTDADVEALKQYALNIRLFGNNATAARKIVDSIDFRTELTRMIGEEFGETINERMRRINDQKHTDIQPYLDTGYRRSSIVMSKQKGARLFDTDPVDNDTDTPLEPEDKPTTTTTGKNKRTTTTGKDKRTTTTTGKDKPTTTTGKDKPTTTTGKDKATTTTTGKDKATTTTGKDKPTTTTTTGKFKPTTTTTTGKDKPTTTTGKDKPTTTTSKVKATDAPKAKAKTTNAIATATKPKTTARPTQRFDGPFNALK